MNLDLSGKNALVCGGSKGIGKATAVELAKLGANVTIVSRSADALSDAVDELVLKVDKQDHDFLVADFSDQADLLKKVTGLLSVKPIHILINNTGGPPSGPILDASTDAFLTAFNNHLICNQLLVSTVVDGMIKEGYGRVINVISTSVKQPINGLAVSNTIRGAVANWSKTLATELGPHGITVNNLLPGSTSTGRLDDILNARATKNGTTYDEEAAKMKKTIPLGRFGSPAEIGSAIAFLASPAAAYISGTNLVVDGGRTKSL